MRTYRGGGLTKDAIYLSGLMEVMDYLKEGGDLGPLFVGKIAAEHVPVIRELRLRKVLQAPALEPRYLGMPGVTARLERLARGMTLTDLVA